MKKFLLGISADLGNGAARVRTGEGSKATPETRPGAAGGGPAGRRSQH